jgi:hypothetical protein
VVFKQTTRTGNRPPGPVERGREHLRWGLADRVFKVEMVCLLQQRFG